MPTGTNWPFVPERFVAEPPATQMPNLSHGLAGIAAALAVAGSELGRPGPGGECAQRGGAPRLAGRPRRRRLRGRRGRSRRRPTWRRSPSPGATDRPAPPCSSGPSSMPASTRSRAGLRRPGTVAACTACAPPGVPERLRPGFWDNDGRCCGTAGVGEVFLDSWQRDGDSDDLAFAVHLRRRPGRSRDRRRRTARTGGSSNIATPTRCSRPESGWMQGAAGIAAYLFHVSRVVDARPEAPSRGPDGHLVGGRLRISAGDASPGSCPRPASACGRP